MKPKYGSDFPELILNRFFEVTIPVLSGILQLNKLCNGPRWNPYSKYCNLQLVASHRQIGILRNRLLFKIYALC